MTTILPQKNKKEIRVKYLLEFLANVLGSLIIISVIWLVFEGTIYYIINSEKTFLQNEANRQSQKNKSTLLANYKKNVRETKQIVDLFSEKKESKVKILDFIFDIKTDKIAINSISIEKGEKDIFVGIGGIATNREALSDFKKILDESSEVSGVDLPVSSFTKTFDIPFTITFVYLYE